MNLKQESKLKMYLALRIFLNVNSNICSLLPNYEEFFAALNKAIIQIQDNSEEQHFDFSGTTENKKELRTKLETIAGDCSRRIVAYAKYINDNLLVTETKFSNSDLRNASDLELLDLSRGLHSKIESKLTSLATYGLTAVTQTNLLAAIDAFDTSIPQRTQKVVTKKENTKKVKEGIAAADLAIEKIDSVVDMLQLSEPTFYDSYKESRKIIDIAGNALSVKGKVCESVKGQPIADASLSFSLSGEKDVVLVKKTAVKGGFQIKSLAEGEYTVTISKVGFITQSVEITVSSSELCVMDVKLVKKEKGK
jgi:hypothetical protein